MKEGDKNALQSIYELHVDTLYRYGRKLAIDTSIAEDCIQDLFIKIWNNRDNLGTTDSIKNYLFTSLRRMIYKAQKSKAISVDPIEMRQGEESEPNFEDLLIQGEMDDERKTAVQRALQGISARQREVIYLRFFQDMEYEEICEVMDISYQGARNMLFKAIKNLKNHLTILLFLITIGYRFQNWVLKG